MYYFMLNGEGITVSSPVSFEVFLEKIERKEKCENQPDLPLGDTRRMEMNTHMCSSRGGALDRHHFYA